MRKIIDLTIPRHNSPGAKNQQKMARPTREEVIMPIEVPPREIQAMRELLNDIDKYQKGEDVSIAAQIISILITEAEHYKTKLLTK